MSTPVIRVQNVNKRFLLPHIQKSTLREHIFSIMKPTKYEEYHALDNVSFEVQKGEFIGIIGRNGCGKSTLLKILAGVYSPDSGSVEVVGRVAPFLELGVGFQGELTARENIYLNGTMLGMSKPEIADAFDEILSFAELERFTDSKLKNFSSGMIVRLAFSIAIRAKADILMLDEVLAVGDSAFQEKCFGVFERLKKEGTTIILVSHSKDSIERFCSRAILLDHGKVLAEGTPKQVFYEYQGVLDEDAQIANVQENSERSEQNTAKTRWGDKKATIQKVSLLDAQGVDTSIFYTNQEMTVQVDYSVQEKIAKPNFAVAIYRENDDLYCFDTNTDLDAVKLPTLTENGTWSITFPKVPLLKGNYYLKVGIFSEYCDNTHDFIDLGPTFSLSSGDNLFGTVLMEHSWTLSSLPKTKS